MSSVVLTVPAFSCFLFAFKKGVCLTDFLSCINSIFCCSFPLIASHRKSIALNVIQSFSKKRLLFFACHLKRFLRQSSTQVCIYRKLVPYSSASVLKKKTGFFGEFLGVIWVPLLLWEQSCQNLIEISLFNENIVLVFV